MPKIMAIIEWVFSIAHNKSRIPEKELNSIIKKLNVNAEIIKNFWIAYHGYETYYM